MAGGGLKLFVYWAGVWFILLAFRISAKAGDNDL
jgi:hypothetical protein